ncbi:hypothetical protein BH11PLA2_BH11PLA2_16150 [soil metagenome]
MKWLFVGVHRGVDQARCMMQGTNEVGNRPSRFDIFRKSQQPVPAAKFSRILLKKFVAAHFPKRAVRDQFFDQILTALLDGTVHPGSEGVFREPAKIRPGVSNRHLAVDDRHNHIPIAVHFHRGGTGWIRCWFVGKHHVTEPNGVPAPICLERESGRTYTSGQGKARKPVPFPSLIARRRVVQRQIPY